MKNRFNFNDENNFPDDMFPDYDGGDGGEHGDTEDQSEEYYDHEAEEIAAALELRRRELNQKILFRTIKSLEKSWFWRLRSAKYKANSISESFFAYQRLISHGESQFLDQTEE